MILNLILNLNLNLKLELDWSRTHEASFSLVEKHVMEETNDAPWVALYPVLEPLPSVDPSCGEPPFRRLVWRKTLQGDLFLADGSSAIPAAEVDQDDDAGIELMFPLSKELYSEEVTLVLRAASSGYMKAKARAASQAAKRTRNDVTAKEDTSQNKSPRTRRTASRSPLSGRSSSTDTPLAPRDEQPTLSSYRCAHHCQHALCG
jgi:hypothetical protein